MKILGYIFLGFLVLSGIGALIYYRRNGSQAFAQTSGLSFAGFASKTDIEDGFNEKLIVTSRNLRPVLNDLRTSILAAQNQNSSGRFSKAFANQTIVVVMASEHNLSNVSQTIVRDANGLRINHDDLINPTTKDVTVTFIEPTSGTLYIL